MGNVPFLPVHLKVKLRDTHGTEATVWLGGMQDLHPTMRSQNLGAERAVLTTLAVPMSAFVAVSPSLDISSLDRLTFRSPTGSTVEVHIDNIQFRGP